jgi:hypothetical protein
MASTFSGRLALNLDAMLNSALDVGNGEYRAQWGSSYVLENGTGANQANALFTDTRTLSASATENLDLAGSLVDAFGATIAFDKIKALIVKADAANVNDVLVGGAASAQASAFFGDVTDVVKVKPGGTVAFIAPDANGYDVTATTADLLKIANSAGSTSVSYTIIIIGVV